MPQTLTLTPPSFSDGDLMSRLAIEQTILHLFACFDRDDAAGVAAAFTAEGVWLHGGREHGGHRAILEEMDRRPTGRRTVHLISNLLIREIAEGRARVAFQALTYAGPTPPAGRPAVLDRPIALDRYEMVAVQGDGRWRVAALGAERLFAPG